MTNDGICVQIFWFASNFHDGDEALLTKMSIAIR